MKDKPLITSTEIAQWQGRSDERPCFNTGN
jgi:hypothetical protein